MKRFFYSELIRVFLTILLLFSSIATGIYGFLTLRGPILYGTAQTATGTVSYSRLFSKYVERAAVYTRYLEEGYSLKYTELTPELELLLSGEATNEDLGSALYNVYRPSETAFYYYHTKLNVEPTNFKYYVINTLTGQTYFSPDFEEYAAKKSGSVDAFLSSGILNENIYAILNTKNNRILTGGGNSDVLNRSSLLWSMDYLTQPLSELAEETGYNYSYDIDQDYSGTAYPDASSNRTDSDTLLKLKEDASSSWYATKDNQDFAGMPKNDLPEPSGDPDSKTDASYPETAGMVPPSPKNTYLVYAFVADTALVDEFSQIVSDFHTARQDYTEGLNYTVLFFLLTFFLFVFCNIISGHRTNNDTIALRPWDKIPTEFFLLAGVLLVCLPFLFTDVLYNLQYTSLTSLYNNYRKYMEWLPLFIVCFSAYLLLFGFIYFSLLRRLKNKSFISSSLLGRYVIKPLKFLFHALAGSSRIFFGELPSLWLTVLGLGAGCILTIFSILLLLNSASAFIGILLLLSEGVVILLLFLHNAVDRRRITRSTAEMAGGDLSARIPLDSMLRFNRLLAEDINHICDGLHFAVEEQIKSERMKTELITNVSHDIKTPLTSIINYIELLKNELPKDGAAAQYTEVLSQKSWRLKSLIDDLVEASKVSSGTIKLEPICFNASELLRQAIGDFEEQLLERELTVIMNLPADPVNVLADGAATHRIIENLLSNICKYALFGTRVFISLDLPADTGLALLTIKNTSEALPSKTPEELLTRFTRGTDSRTGEGSGLGLSIAESLATLQGGSFSIEMEEDVFRAKVTIPLAKTEDK